MKPKINGTSFGTIIIDHDIFDHDVVIDLNGDVNKRKKKLSKTVYGTSHMVSNDEISDIYNKDAELILVGSGQYGQLELSDKAISYLNSHKCAFKVLPTPEAIDYWNSQEGKIIGMFHITC
ncbi:Mth938-like domain-containing protein [Bacteroidota bacterium]